MKDLLLEIGSEEIPAGYIAPALNAMAEKLARKLTSARVDFGEVKTYGTPRRLAVMVKNVAEKQEAVTTELIGPPKKAAYDSEGKPTIAAVKFAEKAGVAVENLGFKETEKGAYLCAVKEEKGEAVMGLLPDILLSLIGEIPFPKSMRWAALPEYFARPVNSLVALYGSDVVPFSFNTISSGRVSYGHFFMAPGEVSLDSPEGYEEALKNVKVMANPADREKSIKEQVDRAAVEVGGHAVGGGEDLLSIVTNLVEFPVAVTGRFSPDYLEVPKEVIIEAMAKHQKYFAVEDEAGNLLPSFIAINNTVVADTAVTVGGHQRVLRARLEDARFFFRADRDKKSFDPWVEELSGILFQAKLGTVRDKIVRLVELVRFLAREAGVAEDEAAWAERAAKLCKADLASQIVGEFPTLQGVMGRIYAGIFKEPPAVATAIEEHYRPVRSGGELPSTRVGALTALADKLDTLCGCFAVGLIPTGASDPYALRRGAIGIVSILASAKLPLNLSLMVEKSLGLIKTQGLNRPEAEAKIIAFLKDRLINLMVDQGHSRDVVTAAAAVSIDDVPLLWRRVKALSRLKTLPDFAPLAVAFKRVVNIIAQAKEKGELPGETGPASGLFEKDCEAGLVSAFTAVKRRVSQLLDEGDVEAALLAVAGLRPSVDAFFDGVMVMAPDEKIRKNRLAILRDIAALFARFADFSKIST